MNAVIITEIRAGNPALRDILKHPPGKPDAVEWRLVGIDYATDGVFLVGSGRCHPSYVMRRPVPDALYVLDYLSGPGSLVGCPTSRMIFTSTLYDGIGPSPHQYADLLLDQFAAIQPTATKWLWTVYR